MQATNREVYEALARPLLGPALTGISATVFAYGVTSSGKTHTVMGGSVGDRGGRGSAWAARRLDASATAGFYFLFQLRDLRKKDRECPTKEQGRKSYACRGQA